MMSVKEYALEINKSVELILSKCRELEINITSENEVLSEEDIIMLDNVIGTLSNGEEKEELEIDEALESKFELEDRAESLVESIGIDLGITEKKQKLKKKTDSVSNIKKEELKEEFINKRKDIYKSKEKLESNKREKDEGVVLYKENMTVKDLAEALGISPDDLVKKLVMMGLMISVNQSISFEDASVIVLDYQKELKKEETEDITDFDNYEIIDNEEDLTLRAPVVTIMGHVDHGKTTLLDYIRNSNVASGEAGGITQAIGAYQVEKDGKPITFIDTPGHAAFTEMRARGASITDIVVIVVAADDGVMPQTKEAVDHAKASGVPIIVAVNKIDKPNINIDRVISEMADLGLTPESWGGDSIFVNISAQTGQNVDLLLDNILALAEVSELKANPNRYASGSVIEAKLDKNVGPLVTLLIQNGTLRIGDAIVVGTAYGKIRTLRNDKGQEILSAGPSAPVEITGINKVPVAGDKFMAFESEKEARAVADKREVTEKNRRFVKRQVSLEDLFESIKEGRKEINIVLKTDVKGSEEAVKNTLEKIDVEDVKLKIIRSGVGAITESDVILANASDAIIIGFNVVPSSKTKEVAAYYNIDIRIYNIIYKLVEDLEAAMKGMLDPEYEEVTTGEAEVRKIFKFSKVGSIAGSHITKGIIKSNSLVRIIRDGTIIFTGKIGSLQREKDSVKEAKEGYDCGITIENFTDIKEKDIVEAYEMKEIKK